MRRLTFIVGLAVAVTGCAPSSPASPSYVVPLTVTQVRTGEPLSAVTLVHPGEPLSSTHLKGEHETPPHDTLAQGQSVMTVSADGQSISFKLMASNIDNVVASHIHVGPIGSPGPVVVFLYGNAAAGGGRHNGILAEGEFGAANLVGPLAGQPLSALLAQMDAGNTYVNVHTNDGVAPTNTGPGDFASGEIRGQIVRK